VYAHQRILFLFNTFVHFFLPRTSSPNRLLKKEEVAQISGHMPSYVERSILWQILILIIDYLI